MHIDLDILIFAVIAVLAGLRLWSLLGTRNEDEPERPSPFTSSPRPDPRDASFNQQASPLLAQMPPPTSLAGGLAQVKNLDPSFDERVFLQMARSMFTTIVESYAKADMTAIAPMLAPDLLTAFQNAADMRARNGQSAQTRVLRIKDAETMAARVENNRAFITVKFISDEENILRDAKGTIIGGGEGKTEEVSDIWVFSRIASLPVTLSSKAVEHDADTQDDESNVPSNGGINQNAWIVAETRA